MKKQKEQRSLWKLNTSLWVDDDEYAVLDWKPDETYRLFARKGQIAERKEITDEIREEYCITESMWKTIYIFEKGNNWILEQREFCDWFDAVN